MKIGIISDSHKRDDVVRSAIEVMKSNGIDILIHAGDIVLEQTLNDMKNSGLKYVAVFGNNDEKLRKNAKQFNIFQEPFYFTENSLKFKLMHYPHYLSNDCNIAIFGHTHYFTNVFYNNTLFINPGEICARKKPIHEFCIVDINNTFNIKNIKITKFFSTIRDYNCNIEWLKENIITDTN